MDLTQKQVKGLQKLAKTLPAFFVLRYFRDLQRSRGYHTAEYLLQIATNGALDFKRDDLVPAYADVLELIKAFDRLGLGDYKIGRKGNKTRIEWADDVGLADVGLAAIPTVDDLVAELDLRLGASGISSPAEGVHLRSEIENIGGTPIIEHSYQLRPAVYVDFAVPRDMSLLEAQRLAAFVGTLSMEG